MNSVNLVELTEPACYHAGSHIRYGEAVKKGDRVEIELADSNETVPGIVERVQAGAALVELSYPLHFMTETKQVIIPKLIHPDMAEPETDLLGYGTRIFLEDIKKLPAGRDVDERLYALNKPMKLKTIIDLCKESEHRSAPQCWLQAAYLNVIPIQV